MDQAWAVEQLELFIAKIDKYRELHEQIRVTGGGNERVYAQLSSQVDEVDGEIRRLEPAVEVMMDAVDPELRNYGRGDPEDQWTSASLWWDQARWAAQRALGLHTVATEAKRRMRPDSPELLADQLHPWVWEAARPMWEAGSPQVAVLHAAQSVNSRIQQKLGRLDASEAGLCQEAFSAEDAKPGRPRLRFPGDRNTDTWKALQNGAGRFGAGCFIAIRNPVAHQHDYPLTQQEALEQLAALSVFARWVDVCSVEVAGT
ncbi:hypothetical protein GCM10010464_00420 [Pseudonocardia yunnanensis]|uniref:TIGR02391 family protein n=1 Tax=Pseudonocardia yunnanensis TaxID=58107 RepID=A0ABW4FB01_9PSEU